MSQTTDARPARMMRAFAGLCFFIFIAGGAFSQNTGDKTALVKPTFQIADIHESSNLFRPKMQGGVVRSGRYELRQATMLDLIVTAYGVDRDTVFGGPAWLELDRFDVIAKVPPDTSLETAKAMLQELLAERFQLKVHKDTKVVPGFALSLDKSKPKLRPAEASGATGCQTSKETPRPGVAPLARDGGPERPAETIRPRPYSVALCRNITMEGFAAALRGLAEAEITGPVADLTQLTGNWDFDFKWTDRRLVTSAGTDITLFNAISKQLGLVLEPKRVRVPVLVVDHANQKPTANPPNSATLLPPPPEFEAASIKPSQPGTSPRGRGFLPGGRVEMLGTPLALLLLTAWDLNLPPDEIPGAPKWLTPFEPTFDLMAKAPASTIESGVQLYRSDYQMMLRTLLIDRFKIVTHYEDRPMNTYVLVAQKPKLRKADPSNRTGCKTVRSPAPRPSELAPLPLEAVCKNITMTQFAEQLQIIAPVYFRYPVLDATAIVGAWDFTFTFSPLPPDLLGGGGGVLRSADPNPTAGTAGVPSDPVGGGVSIFDAIKKELGLKLEVQKRPQPVLVIDHIEQKPTEN